jgi:hypothetical protein
MYPTHVALVPYGEEDVPTDELLHVASALQTQVTRDLGPIWDLSAVVSPFLRLEDVPAGYVPFAIVEELPKPWHGFHIVTDGQPLALIGYRKGWSLLASHELMELLCDPWGSRRLAGASLQEGQGQVEYLVEVCDPCQLEKYMIHDIHLSDFVTPDYYGTPASKGGRYSFTGSVKRPLEVRDGGYVTWRTPDGQIWQKSGGEKPRQLKGATFSRASIDSHPAKGRPDVADGLPRGGRSRGPHYGLEKSARRYGKRLKTDIDRILEQLGAKPPISTLKAIVTLLEEFSNEDSEVRTEFERNPEETLKRYKLDTPPNLDKLIPLAPPEHYCGVLAALEGGLGLGDPKLAAWLSTHAAFHHAGIE